MATKASAQNVDFSNVKDGGNFNKNRIPAGDYLATVTKVEDAESKKDGAFQYLISIKINKRPSSVFPYYCKLQENQLWKLRNILIAAGITVPKRRVKVDPNRLVGKTIGVTVEDADYDGKDQSEIGGVFPASELSDGYSDDPNADEDEDGAEDVEDENLEDLEDEEPEDEDDEVEADDEPIDPYADLDRAALKAELKKRDSAFQARKSQSDDDLRALLREGDGAADEDDEEEEEPTPPPAKKKAAPAARRSRRKAAPKPEEVTDEELEELDIDDL